MLRDTYLLSQLAQYICHAKNKIAVRAAVSKGRVRAEEHHSASTCGLVPQALHSQPRGDPGLHQGFAVFEAYENPNTIKGTGGSHTRDHPTGRGGGGGGADLTIHQAPKCVLDSTSASGPLRFPTMSTVHRTYAHLCASLRNMCIRSK